MSAYHYRVWGSSCGIRNLVVVIIGVRGGGSGGAAAPQSWKFSGQTLISGQAQVAQKTWMIKNIYSIQWIQGKLCCQGKRKLLKKPEW